jgi:hypothetical protein
MPPPMMATSTSGTFLSVALIMTELVKAGSLRESLGGGQRNNTWVSMVLSAMKQPDHRLTDLPLSAQKVNKVPRPNRLMGRLLGHCLCTA